MDVLWIELLLWGGLVFLFWALKDALNNVEGDIEAWGSPSNATPVNHVRYSTPEEMAEVIGSYRDAAIYRYVTLNHVRYTFDHIRITNEESLRDDERCVAPGLVYVQCLG